MNVIDGILKELKELSKRVGRLEVQKHRHPIWNLGTPTELTIAGGVITRTRSNHAVDTEADAGTDDLDTINGGVSGDILIIRAADSARDVVVKNNTGNINIAGAADYTLDNTVDTLTLLLVGTTWVEIARSDNA